MKITDIVSFGKYKGKTFESIVGDKSYVNYILSNFEGNTPQRKEMLDFLRLYDSRDTSKKAVGSITSRCKIFQENRDLEPFFKTIGFERKFIVERPIMPSSLFRKYISKLKAVDPSLTGIYIDYLVRFLISVRRGSKFIDDRAEEIISRGKCDELLDLSLPKIDFSYNLINTSNRDISNLHFYSLNLYSISLCHSLYFGRLPSKYLEMIPVISEFDFQFFIDELYTIVGDYLLSGTTDNTPIKLNPSFEYSSSDEKLCGDPDLIIGESLIDIKVTSYPMNNYELLQLFGYFALSSSCGCRITNIATFNLDKCCLYSVDVSTINEEKVDFILKYFTNQIPSREISPPSFSKKRTRSCGGRKIIYSLLLGVAAAVGLGLNLFS